jgi:hypothetical protein
MLQCATVRNSNSAAAKSAELNTALMKKLHSGPIRSRPHRSVVASPTSDRRPQVHGGVNEWVATAALPPLPVGARRANEQRLLSSHRMITPLDSKPRIRALA